MGRRNPPRSRFLGSALVGFAPTIRTTGGQVRRSSIDVRNREAQRLEQVSAEPRSLVRRDGQPFLVSACLAPKCKFETVADADLVVYTG